MYLESLDKIKDKQFIRALVDIIEIAAYDFPLGPPNTVMIYQTEPNPNPDPFVFATDPWAIEGFRRLFKLKLKVMDDDLSYKMKDYTGALKSRKSQAEFIETLKDPDRILRIVFIDTSGIYSSQDGKEFLSNLDLAAEKNYEIQQETGDLIATLLSKLCIYYLCRPRHNNEINYLQAQQSAYVSPSTALSYPILDIYLYSDVKALNAKIKDRKFPERFNDSSLNN